MDMVQHQIAIEVLTRVVNFIDIQRGDDGEDIRLLSSLEKQFPYRIRKLYRLRDHIFLIDTAKGRFVLKGYSSYSRLKLQEAFTASLKTNGFQQTYSFIHSNRDSITYKNKYYGCLEYITPHPKAFSYVNEQDRREGLKLLKKYHRTTEQCIQSYQTILPVFDIEKKWLERYSMFRQNLSIVSNYLPQPLIQEWLRWAEWSLSGIQRNSNGLKEPYVILHGDVAHHNFLRKKDGKLYLIDFDLISMGPKNFDLLQYANRILPFIHWDMNALFQYEDLKNLFQNSVYLYSLGYPTDLFREWNRIIREGITDEKRLHVVINQSLANMEQRQNFSNNLKKILSNSIGLN
jgi:thiamine kinase-like enzyme